MPLGYDGKLYILAFDHRGSFQKKMFGIEGDPTPEQTETIADAKHLIYEGMLKAVEKSDVHPDQMGVLVDEQFGAPKNIPADAKAAGLKLAMPVEKSGQDMFDFEYGADFGEHILKFDPDFSKVLVRYNPEHDKAENEEQLGKLKREAEVVYGDAGKAQPVGADADRGAFVSPTLLYCRDAGSARAIHSVEAFGPVCTLMPYDSVEEAIALARRGGGSLAGSIFSADDGVAAQLVLGLAPYHGRVVVVNRHCAKESTGHGSPLPHLVHGGPGRAGGGSNAHQRRPGNGHAAPGDGVCQRRHPRECCRARCRRCCLRAAARPRRSMNRKCAARSRTGPRFRRGDPAPAPSSPAPRSGP